MRKLAFVLALSLLVGAGGMFAAMTSFSGEIARSFPAQPVRVQGVVVALQLSGRPGRPAGYVPVVEYRDAFGNEQRFRGTTASNPPAYQPGQQVAVIYDAAAPQSAIIDNWLERYLGPALLGGFSLALMLVLAVVVRVAAGVRSRR